MQEDESRRIVPIKKYEDLSSKLKDTQDQLFNLQAAQDKELRKIKEERRAAQAEADEARADLLNLEREHKQALQDADSKRAKLEQEGKDVRTTLSTTTSALENSRDRLLKKEAEASEFESENLRLKAQSGDSETLEVIKRDLAEQVAHIRKLESINRDQNSQLKTFRQKQKAVEVVEEEKRTLELRLSVKDNLEKELEEAQLQRQILVDEKSSWTSYLQNQIGDSEADYKSPEDLARALVKERLETASTMERLGALQSELLEKDGAQQILAEERARMQVEIDTLKATGAATAPARLDSRTKKALERQRAMALKEIEFLREQLRTFDSEEQTYHSSEGNPFDAVKTRRIADLESQLDGCRRELATLTSELAVLESQATPASAPRSPLKRPRSDDEDERLGQLSRKNRKLQDDFSQLQSTHSILQNDHNAIKSQLQNLKEKSRTRVLSLRSNPTTDFEAIKASTLSTLKQENHDLLARLDNSTLGHTESKHSGVDLVPKSTLDALRLELKELERTVAEKEKRMLRLKQIWGSKSLEFREAVFSLLGWKMEFRANGKFALSLQTGNNAQDADNEGDDPPSVEETLIFDGENGTMKVAGGMDSPFAREVRPLTKEWVEGKRYIPGLMASVLLSKVGDGTVVI